MPTNSSSVSRGVVVVAAILCIGSVSVAIVSVNKARETRARLEQSDAELQKLQVAKTFAADIDKLRKLLKQKDSDYTTLSGEFDKLKQRVETPTAQPTDGDQPVAVSTKKPAPANDGRSWMDRLKEEDPERYKQMQEDREKRRQQFAAQFQAQITRIDERLQSAKTQDEVDLLTSLAGTLGKVDELRKSWETVRSLPEQDRREQAAKLGAESMQTYQQLTELRTKDRQLQLQQLAGQVGYADPKVAGQFVDSVNRIYSETDTSINRMLGFGPGGFGRGGGFGGGPGGGGGGQPPQ